MRLTLKRLISVVVLFVGVALIMALSFLADVWMRP